jgi:hypothetical protein
MPEKGKDFVACQPASCGKTPTRREYLGNSVFLSLRLRLEAQAVGIATSDTDLNILFSAMKHEKWKN